MAAASSIRGLPVRSAVRCVCADQWTFRRLAQQAVSEDINQLKLSKQKEVLVFLGILDPSYPFERCIVDEYARQAMAFYSATLKEIVVPDWYEVPSSIIVHELVHALQDQHFDTHRFGRAGYLFDDRNLAAGMLLEGDAMQIEQTFARTVPGEDSELDRNQLPPQEAGCNLPAFLSRLASSVYDYGTYFVESARSAGKSLDPLFENPPRSTKALLYPKHEEASRGAESPPTSPTRIVVGELGIRMALKQQLSSREAVAAASGWRADELRVGTGAHDIPVSWRTIWASEDSARVFYTAWLAAWSKRLDTKLDPRASAVIAQVGPITLSVRIEGSEVTTACSRKTNRSG